MSLSLEFWIGMALAVPLSILASLLAPRVQTWIDSRSKKASRKRAAELREELQRISSFKNDPTQFYIYLLEAGIKIALLWCCIRASRRIAVLGLLDGYTSGIRYGLVSTVAEKRTECWRAILESNWDVDYCQNCDPGDT